MKSDSGEARKSTAPTRSSAASGRFRHWYWTIMSTRACERGSSCTCGITAPGAIAADAVAADLPGQRPREADDAGLRGDVVDHVGETDPDEVRRHVDDPAAAL